MERIKTFRINPEKIGFFKWILESYEEVAIFSVVDGDRGLIEISCGRGFEADLALIIADMAHYDVRLEEVPHV